MGDSAIQWTDKVWNPTVGCRRVSEGCRFCYAKTLHDQRHKAHRAGKKVPAQYAHPFEVVQLMPDRLTDPLSWRKPCRVFVNSVSDLFHADVPFEFIDRVFAVMALAPRHTFQVLTKRAERMREYLTTPLRIEHVYDQWHEFSGGPREAQAWPLPNVWCGVSCEHQAAADERVPHLLATPAAVRFLSCEPLLEGIHFGRIPDPELPGYQIGAETALTQGIDWVIVGGESGPGARPMEVEWARGLVRQCQAAAVPVFVKQLGATPTGDYYRDRETYEDRGIDWPDALGWNHRDGQPPIGSRVALPLAHKKGGDPDEWPEDLRVRQFPKGAA